jgi:hypothetical protein
LRVKLRRSEAARRLATIECCRTERPTMGR